MHQHNKLFQTHPLNKLELKKKSKKKKQKNKLPKSHTIILLKKGTSQKPGTFLMDYNRKTMMISSVTYCL